MRKKVQGRKGRPTIGKQRTFSCSDEDYALIHKAAKITNAKVSAFVRDAAVEKANQITSGQPAGAEKPRKKSAKKPS